MPPPRQQTMPNIAIPSTVVEVEHAGRKSVSDNGITADVDEKAALNLRMANPLGGMSHAQLLEDGRSVAINYLHRPEEAAMLSQGAMVAANPGLIDSNKEYFEQGNIEMLMYEREHPWLSMPSKLITVVVINSLCAAVQGMDETVVNGAQLFYAPQFGIENSPWILGLVNSAPYLACAVAGCWLSIPLNRRFGRRGTIFLCCACDIICCLAQACVNNWYGMFIARFFLGLGIGAKSATVPIYSAECAPSAIRGALTMQWQMWTAFGIMLGFASDLIFYKVKDIAGIVGLNWRLMMGSACLFAIFVDCTIFFCPESPRYLIEKAERLALKDDIEGSLKCRQQAWESTLKLRKSKIQAARDFYIMYKSSQVQAEAAAFRGNAFQELWGNPRNRRAMYASQICMFMQQFCGVNVIAYYSSVIFVDAGFSEKSALLASLGFGLINFFFAIPAVYTIDSFGRRNLLLATFPLLAGCLLLTGFSFLITDPQIHIGLVATGIYLFGVFYSPGAGPVPFTYAAEAYPLYVRTHGMSLGTSTTWGFNFLLGITWPKLLQAFTATGAFCYYAAWLIVGFFFVLCFVPETRGYSLEQLDIVFSQTTRHGIQHGFKQLAYWCSYVFTWGKTSMEAPVFVRIEDMQAQTNDRVGPRISDDEEQVMSPVTLVGSVCDANGQKAQ